MRMLGKIHFVLTAILVVGGTAALSAQGQEVLTLDDAVARALAHNYSVQKAMLNPKKAGDEIAALRTQRLPQFRVSALAGQLLNRPTITFSQGVLGNLPNNQPLPAQTAHIPAPERPGAIGFAQINLPLSQQYRIGLDLQKLEVAKMIRQEESRQTKADVVAAVHAAYYKLLRTELGMATSERTLQTYKEMERVTIRYASEQTVLRSELLTVQAQRARAEYDATVFRDQFIALKEQMNSLLGRPIEVEFTLRSPEDPEQASLDLVALRERALAVSPAVKQAELRVQEAHIGRRIKKSEYIPDISLNAGYLAAPGLPNLLPQRIAAVGFVIDWQPFDWGRKRHESDELARFETEAELSLREAKDQVRIAVGTQVRRLAEARQLLAAARINQESAQEEVRIMEVRYSQSATLLKNVIESQAGASRASEQTMRALEEWWVAQTDLKKILGETQ